MGEIKENQLMLWDRIKDLENHIGNFGKKGHTLEQNEVSPYLPLKTVSEIQEKDQLLKIRRFYEH